MTTMLNRTLKAGLVTGTALLLSGCFLSPGTFTSELQINDDGRFAYRYDGEINIIGVGQMAEMGAALDDDEFIAAPCETDDGEERDCTQAELKAQEQEWDETAPERAVEREQEAQMMKVMLGEVDLSDPDRAAEFTRKLERQKGWNSVTYREDGVFDVSFAVDGMLTHDFLFPMMEGFPMPGAFVQVYLRDDDQVRIEAPGFGGSGGAGGMGGLGSMGGLGALMAMAGESEDSSSEGPDLSNLPVIDGQFSITTNATILANNTDEGPVATPTGSVLNWKIDAQTLASPTALLQLKQ